MFKNLSDSSFHYFSWYFGDGDSVVNNGIQSVFHSYSQLGKYLVKLKGVNNAGYVRWYSDSVVVQAAPIADFSSVDSLGCQFAFSKFIAHARSDSINPNTGATWNINFGDGSSVLSSDSIFGHKYVNPGVFNVSLIYSNGYCTDTLTQYKSIHILPAPKPGFTVSDTVGCQPLTLKLTSNASGTITKTYFDFGNGTNASVSSPTVVYSSSGSFKILQEVTGPNGCVTKDSVAIKVNPTPVVKFKGTDSICQGSVIQLGNPAIAGFNYSWTSVPPGFISDLSNPLDIPKQTTTYDLKETISATGCMDSGKAVSCFVELRPMAAFAYKYLRGFDYQFSVKRSKNVSYRFDFGDSQHISLIKNDSSISHTFPGNGTYIVTLTSVSDTDLKCVSTITDTIEINEPFSLNIFPNPFSLQTDINYLLLKPGHVKISFTDEIGRQIGTLVDKQLGPGEYDTEFNAPLWETRPGMYFVLFQLDDTLIVKKIIQMESIFY